MKHPRLCAVKASAELLISISMSLKIVRQILRSWITCVFCPSKISEKKRKLSSAKINDKPVTYWNNVPFADESKIKIFGSDGRITIEKEKMRKFTLRT